MPKAQTNPEPAPEPAAPTTADQLIALIRDRYHSRSAFAAAIGIPSQTLYSILQGDKIQSCSLASAMAITKALDLDPYAFAEGRLVPASPTATPVPVYDQYTPNADNQPHSQFPIPTNLAEAHPGAFMLRITDNSANQILKPGFLALVAPAADPDAEEPADAHAPNLQAVSINNAPAIIRRVINHDHGFTLAPASDDPTYKPMLVDFNDPEAPTVTRIGPVIWYCSPIGSTYLAD